MPAEAGPPEILLVRGSPEDRTAAVSAVLDAARSQALVVGVCAGAVPGEIALSGAGAQVATRYGIDLLEHARRMRLTGAAGESTALNLPRLLDGSTPAAWAGLPERVVLVGLGTGGPTDLRRAGAALGRAVEGLEQAVAVLGADGRAPTRALVEGFLLAAYRPPRTGRADPPTPPARRLVLLGEHDADAVGGARRSAAATWAARRLAATPSNVKDPVWFAGEARALVGDLEGVSVTAYDEAWLAGHGFGGLLAVGQGSASPPRLVVVDYAPPAGGQRGRHVALVGKGITFDTGGLSVKTGEAMSLMKTDMAGAAAALAAVVGAAQAGVPHRVSAVLPLAENAFGGDAYRPGDVLRTHDGTTVEVLNTDAEGRLVLADALSWVRADLRPDVVVDIATLTGAASLGLGRRHAALYATDESLAAALVDAGEATGERAWRMPLVEDYADALFSPVADVANIARDPHVHGGSILAALFLRRFVEPLAWAHLDIAGPARATKTEHEVTEGPSGFGARLLLRFLEDLSA